MKRKKISSLILIIIIIAIGLTSFFFFRDHSNSDEITLYGNVDVRQVDIAFRVSGQVTQLFFEEGDRVNAGDLMCRLDPTPYNSQLQEAVSAKEAIIANLANAEVMLDRRKELIGIGAVSQEDLDNAQANRDQLCANLMQSNAAISVAQDNLDYTQARAPTDGIILTRIREPGTVVNPADPVYTLSVSSPVWIRAFVNEPHLGDVYYGMEAKVYTDNGREYTGKIGFISPVAEFTPKTVESVQLRTDLVYRLRIYVDNPDMSLVQGMPVTVKLYIGSST
ncbi:MAG: efflux RND transporter periplasmic adaptor subunit [Simkaniaceae bacterium]|nr:efflux RND transporter periplasmic adaptor subunit [Simkaniaceae bacterium]